MKVGELRRIIENLDDETEIVRPAFDHSYTECDIEVATAMYDGYDRRWVEDHGESVTPEADYGQRTPVLIIR